MPRLATTVALAAWIGFLAVYSAELIADAISPAWLAALSAGAGAGWLASLFDTAVAPFARLGAPLELLVAAICLGIIGLLARSLYLLQSPTRRDPARAERTAFAAFATIGVLASGSCAASIALLPVDVEGGSVWLSLALSIAAIVFDRMVEIEADDAGDADFEAGITAIAQGLAQQTRIYTPAAGGERDARR